MNAPNRRDILRSSAQLATAWAAASMTASASIRVVAPAPAPSPLGVVIHSYNAKRFTDPLAFLEHCRGLGATGIQIGVGRLNEAESDRLRQACQAAKMHLEGIVGLPKGANDVARFEAEIKASRQAGATIVRSVMLNSRRYETFDSVAAFREFARQSRASLDLARPIVERHGAKLAIENHKDWRADDLVRILKGVNSPNIGVCLDTGNSIALLEEPHEVVETLAPYAFTTHFKDMAVADFEDGFLLAEVPLGQGFLDLPRMIRALRAKNPEIRLNLEMITRDPLRVPCLTPKYWTTFEDLPARVLADALRRTRRSASRQPLATVSGLDRERQARVEQENVERCFAYARGHLS